jgi:hypothetical protein
MQSFIDQVRQGANPHLSLFPCTSPLPPIPSLNLVPPSLSLSLLPPPLPSLALASPLWLLVRQPKPCTTYRPPHFPFLTSRCASTSKAEVGARARRGSVLLAARAAMSWRRPMSVSSPLASWRRNVGSTRSPARLAFERATAPAAWVRLSVPRVNASARHVPASWRQRLGDHLLTLLLPPTHMRR